MSGDQIASIEDARSIAQSCVTELLHGHRSEVAVVVEDLDNLSARILALVALDLVAYVHHSWSRATGISHEGRNESWSELMLDVAEWEMST